MILWMDGQFIEEEQDIKISPFDHGYLYGLNFFKTFRTYKGKVVLFQEHYSQLISTLNEYRIKMPYTVIELMEVIEEITNKANGQDGMIRLNISAGNQSKTLQLQPKYNKPNVIIFYESLAERKRGLVKSGKWLKTKKDPAKYNNKYLGSLEVDNIEKVEGFFTTPKGYIADGIHSNIFWVKDQILYTPDSILGIEEGVIRQWVIQTAKIFGYRVVEGLFFPKELENAFECFITNSVDEIVPISNIGRAKFLGENGPLYQQLHQAYIDEILKTIREAI